MIVSAPDDDGLDWDSGFTGNVQFAVVDRLGLAATGSSDPHGIEGDSNSFVPDLEPRSAPTLFNLTLVGDRSLSGGRGIVLRRGSWGTIRNAIVMEHLLSGVNIRDMPSIAAVGAGLQVTHSIFHNNAASSAQHFSYGTGAGETYDTLLDDPWASNRAADPGLGVISNTNPNYVPPLMSPAESGGDTPPMRPSLQSQTIFVGAFGPGCPDWSRPWASYPAN